MTAEAKLTFYDFLTYEVIGVLILVLCSVFPSMFFSEWMFFVIAFIAGFIFSKLSENAFWFKWIRNPECLIIKANKDLIRNIQDHIKYNYLSDYYTLSEKKTYDTVRVLEAQFAFVYNLCVLFSLYTIVNYNDISKICLDNFTFDLFNSNVCCSKIYHPTTISFVCFAPMIKAYLTLIICVFIEVICQAFELIPKSYNKALSCRIKPNIYCKTGFRYLFAGIVIILTIYTWISPKLIHYLIIAIITLAFIAYNIQKKISYLIVEGAHYNRLAIKKTKNQQVP